MDKPKPTSEREISDLILVAYLSIAGHRIIGIEPRNGRSVFIFRSTPELKQDELRFFNKEASVEPMSFAEKLRFLKAAAR